MKHKLEGPEFLWGVATSAHQIEGDNKDSDWWAWEAEGHIEGAVRSGKATDHRRLFAGDLDLAQSLGVNSYRFSIEWARVEPREGEWSEAAFAWYEALLSGCEKRGLVPMITLFHFTLPRWFAEEGGFSADQSAEKFLRFVSEVVRRFGARIPLWCTLNEPFVFVVGAYLGRFMPPAVYSPSKASAACANLLRCHTLAYDLVHTRLRENRVGPFRARPLMVGYAHNMIDLMPERTYHPLEALIARRLSHLYNFAWLEATMGRAQNFSFPFVLPRSPKVKEAVGKARADFIGVNYYTRGYVQWRPRAKDSNQVEIFPLGLSFARRKEVSSDLGWSVRPEGLGKLLKRVARYSRPVIITENGIADRADQLRPAYLREHLLELARVSEAIGLDVRGYYHWSLLDNFEWIKGFWPRFGLFAVDYETFERKPTHSASLYREIIRRHAGQRPKADLL